MDISGLLDNGAIASRPSPEITSKLKVMLPENPFHIKGTEAERIASKLGISKYQLMIELIEIARSFAVTPVSRYNVGSCAMGLSGDFYLGVNLEFGGANLDQTVHSEQCVSCNAMSHGEEGLSVLAVSSAPCGYCRQFLNEMACAGNLKVMIPEKPVCSLAELLPHSFGPKDLGIEAGMPMAFEKAISLEAKGDALVERALREANKTYAPYSHCNAAVALELKDGRSVSGRYFENAAFNPSLSPLQAALIMTVVGGGKWSDIKRGVLVEREGNVITHAPASSALLKAIAPQADFSVHFGR